MEEIYTNEEDKIRNVLMGKRIVGAEIGDFTAEAGGDRWNPVTGKLTLNDGTVIYIAPNQGGCACSAGDYFLTSLATVDNIITDVKAVAEEEDKDNWDYGSTSYRIYVIADNVQINAVQIDGDDGNGYYGTGYELFVVPA